jgi:uncharacterized phage protein (TIGR01671 family)
MKRDILFRGKTNSGEWALGCLVYSRNISPALYFEVGKGEVKSFDWAYVKADTVGQLLEMTDRNGHSIFEDDIVKTNFIYHGKPTEPTFLSKIVYNRHIDAWQISYLNRDGVFVNDNIGFKYSLEVIGNIHDNPELLKP